MPPSSSVPPASAPASHPESAVAIVNARVWTGDPRRPWADAVLVRGDRIVAVGSSAEVNKRTDKGTRIIDARGFMLTPGLVDSHVHLLGTIVPGALADLVLIDCDVTRIAPETIRDAQVMLTMTGGRVVYDRSGLTR